MSKPDTNGFATLMIIFFFAAWFVAWLFGSPGEGHNWNSKQIRSYNSLRDAGFSDSAARKAVR